MSPAFAAMLLALVVAPAVAYLVYRLARGLGFLDPPADKQHEHRRAIIITLYALLVFLPVLLHGFEKRWPPAWILLGIASGAALVVFAFVGIRAAIALWKLRHPDVTEPRSETEDSDRKPRRVPPDRPPAGTTALGPRSSRHERVMFGA